jgi:hypothetical protein
MSSLPPVPEMLAAAYAGTDWAASPLGPMETWSPTLRRTVDMVFATRFPVTLFWGPELALVYNEAYVPLIGDKHPSASACPHGRCSRGEGLDRTHDGKRPVGRPDMGPRRARAAASTRVRRGVVLHVLVFPVRNEHGDVEGVMDIAAETTEQVISRRRLLLLTAVTERIANADDLVDLVRVVLPLLRSSAKDLPVVDIRLPGARLDVDYSLPGAPWLPMTCTSDFFASWRARWGRRSPASEFATLSLRPHTFSAP